MREEACVFGGACNTLVGVITDPAASSVANALPAVILLNSGIVHRVGLNRLHVKLARILAAMGFVTMRFDFSGIGDSPPRQDNLPFRHSAIAEIQEAMNHLAVTRGRDRFILMGICSGAGIALQTAQIDARVVAVAPINCRGYLTGPGADVQIRNRALLRHYWRIAFRSSFQLNSCLKALTGKMDYGRLARTAGAALRRLVSTGKNRPVPPVEDRFRSDVRSLLDRGAHLLFVHAEGDEGLDFIQMALANEIEQWSRSKPFGLKIIAGANHTFALLWTQERLLRILCEWTEQVVHGPPNDSGLS